VLNKRWQEPVRAGLLWDREINGGGGGQGGGRKNVGPKTQKSVDVRKECSLRERPRMENGAMNRKIWAARPKGGGQGGAGRDD